MPNAYNLVRLEPGRIRNEVRTWNGREFATSKVVGYHRVLGRWALPELGAALK